MGTATEVLARASAATSTAIPNANLRHAEPARHAARCAQHIGTRRENGRQPGSESSCTAVGREAPSRWYAHPAGMIVGMKAHRMRPAEPTHEPAHFAIEQRAYNQVVMIGHQLIGEQFDLMNLQRFMQNPLERLKVGVLVKDRRA